MELSKSVLLQKQVKDNSQDLQNEFCDLKNWEKEMRQKDEQLRKESAGQSTIIKELPPVRSKKSKKEKKAEEERNGNAVKAKKIRSYDYSAWDKFDAEKACEEVDKENNSDESGDEPLSQQKLEEAYEEATKHKNEGNIFVQQKKWDKAIAKYTEALKLFPYDAIFYANRALCQLKLDNLYSAESDCTAAIQLDEAYVKAYHRRATVRVALKRYKDAKEDLEKILKLDPLNKESKALLAEVEKNIGSSEPSEKPQKPKTDEKSIEKTVCEKMFPSAGPSKKPTEIKKHEEKIQPESSTPSTSKVENASPKGKKYLDVPDWLPEKDDVAIVEPVEKPPHLRSKKMLTKVPVKEVEYIEQPDKPSTDEGQEKILAGNSMSDGTKQSGSSETLRSNENTPEIPPVPKTATQFMMNWRKNTSSEFRYRYLLQLHQLPSYSVFEDLIEPDVLSDIIEVLTAEFIKRQEDVYTDLHKLTLIKRFKALTMLMSNKDKENLKILFAYMAQNYGDLYDDKITDLRKAYEL